MRWSGRIKHLDEFKNVHEILECNPQGKILRGNIRVGGKIACKYEGNSISKLQIVI